MTGPGCEARLDPRRARLAVSLAASLLVGAAVAGWSASAGAATPTRDSRPFCAAVAGVQAQIVGGQLSVTPAQATTVVAALNRAAPAAPTPRLRTAVKAIARFYRRLENGRLPPTRDVLALAKPLQTYSTGWQRACAGIPVPAS